jgi:hypothetical protein
MSSHDSCAIQMEAVNTTKHSFKIEICYLNQSCPATEGTYQTIGT